MPLILVETVCGEETAVERIRARAGRGGSPSDATVEVYRRKRAAHRAVPPAVPRGAIHVEVDTDADGPVDLDPALAALRRQGIIVARIPVT